MQHALDGCMEFYMFDNLQNIDYALQFSLENIAIWLVPIFLCLTSLLFMMPVIHRFLYDRRTTRKIKRLGRESLYSVVINNEFEDPSYIEYLILLPKGILIIMLLKYRGLIFGSHRTDSWTQMVGSRSYKFPNPLHKIESDIISVKTLAPDVEVMGRVVFTSENQFPKGKPDGVLLIDEIDHAFMDIKAGRPSDNLQNAWHNIINSVESGVKVPTKDLGNIGNVDYDNGYMVFSLLLLLISALWMTWWLFDNVV